MLPAELNLPRQLSDRDPVLLWRDRSAGGREGVALLPQACEDPGCSCREIFVEALAVSDDLISIATDGRKVSIIAAPGSSGLSPCVLRAKVNVDTGAAEIGEDAPPFERDRKVLEWLRAELATGPLLECLRRRFRLAKHLSVEPPPSRQFDWKRWKPGQYVCWEEAFPEATPTQALIIGDRVLAVRQWYCANPRCACEEVQLFVHEPLANGTMGFVGSLTVDTARSNVCKLSGETDDASAVLANVWAELKGRHDVASYFGRRHRAVQAAAIQALRPSHQGIAARPSAVPRNAPCPCGSGLKYKKCCMGKAEQNI